MQQRDHDAMGLDAAPILVTGGAGFIGSHVVEQLHALGATVRVLERSDAAVDHLPMKHVEIVRADIRDAGAVQRAMSGCKFVLHLAANPNLWARDPREFDEVNHRGTRNVLNAARQHGVARVVHVSTESILTSPDSNNIINEQTPVELRHAVGDYCKSKARAELAAMEFAKSGLPVVIASPTVPVGPGDRRQGPLTRLMCQFSRGQVRGYVRAEVNIVDVRDVATGIIAALQRGRIGKRYLLAGENWTIRQLFETWSELLGVPAPRLRVPYSLALGFAWAEEQSCRMRRRHVPMATVTGVRLSRRRQQFDGSTTNTELNLQLRPCLDSMRDQIQWLAARGETQSTPHAHTSETHRTRAQIRSALPASESR